MSDVTPEIWKLIEQMRSKRHRPDPFSILKEAKSQNIPISLDQVRYLIMQEEGKMGNCPDFIPAFIMSYLKESPPKTILDCWAGIGAILSPLFRKFKPTLAIAINLNSNEHEAASLLHPDLEINWKLGEPIQILDEIDTRFDVVVGSPPFGWKPTSLALSWDNSSVNFHDYLGNIVLLKACQLLEPGGVGFLIVSSNFLREKSERKVYTHLEQFGLFIDAALSLPSGTFAPATQIESLLLIVRKQKSLRLFVGELRADQTSNALLQHLKARKRGKTPHLGALVESTSFRSFSILVAEYEIKETVKKLGLSTTPVSEICTAINLPKGTEGEEFSDFPNAVYLPLIGRSPAVASLANLQIKAQNYIQLVLNPDKAIAEYVANFLNTVLGQKIRESLLSGNSILKISKSQLANADFYLPNVEIQSEIIGIKSEITNLSTQLETLERQLWERPQKYKETQKAVSLLNHVDNFDAWVESLPFPLASILWQYHANNDVKEKVEYLLNFFEALSQFIAVIMLSAYAADENLYIEESPNWVEPKKSPYRDWILKPSFGSWIIFGRKLATVTRRLQQDKDKKEIFLELFGKPNHEFLGMLTDKNLFNELDVASTYRNFWKGHGGAANEKEHQRRLKLLESSLSKVRQVIRDKWEMALLLLPVVNRYTEDGVFDYQVQALMGTKTPFKKVKKQTLVPMEDGKLYLLHTNQQRPVKLLPFIRLTGNPKTEPNACYFYNRQGGEEEKNRQDEEDKNQVRWLSYHFGSDPSKYSPFTEIKPAIELICPTADNTEESSA